MNYLLMRKIRSRSRMQWAYVAGIGGECAQGAAGWRCTYTKDPARALPFEGTEYGPPDLSGYFHSEREQRWTRQIDARPL